MLCFHLKAGLFSSGADTGKGKSKMSKHTTHGFHCLKGKSNHGMEDYVVSEFKKKEDSELGLFAIFDGHLGHDVAKYLQSHLFDNILKQVEISVRINIRFCHCPYIYIYMHILTGSLMKHLYAA